MMLALTIALRELRGGVRDFRIFFSCLIIGVTVIAAVGTLSTKIERGIQEQAKTLLGGDIEISLTNAEVTKEEREFFSAYGNYSLSVNLRAMATYGDNAVLVELKGIDDAYPLLGNVQLASGNSLETALIGGKVIAEESLLSRLGAKPNDTITIGTASFVIGDILQKEPDHIASAFSLGPRVMARTQDLRESGLLAPGGLIKYNYHILLRDPAELGAFQKALLQKFPHEAWTIKTFNDNNRTVKNLVERLQLFMTLAGLSSLLIGGVGILNAIESYVSKKLQTIAIMKTLGAPRNLVFSIYLMVLFIVTLLGTFISALAGSFLAQSITPYLAQFFPISAHIIIDYKSILLAMIFGMLTVFTFSIAVLGKAIEVKPTLLFRGIEAMDRPLPSGKRIANIILIIALIAIVLLSSNDLKVAAGFIGVALLSFVIFVSVARLIKVLALKTHATHPIVKLAIGNLHRPGNNIFSIMLSIGIGLTVLIALLQVEGNIREEIDNTIPANAPSVFLIDIQPSEKDAFINLLHSKPYISEISYAPMVRGRISRLNNSPVENAPIGSDAKWATESDRGLSYTGEQPSDTHLVKGAWWPANYQGKPLLSLDKNLAKGMGLTVGDTITLNILGQEVQAEIANLRDVNYANFHINFAMILSPGALEHFPATYIATVRIEGANETNFIHEISKQFPNISTISIKDSLLQLKGIVDDIALAIRITALAALVSGLLVLASALAATLDKRTYDTVVMKVLGARKKDILNIFLIEWLILGLITGLVACALGTFGAWLIMQRFDWITFHWLPIAMLAIVCLAILCIITIGSLIQFRIFGFASARILRNE